MSAKILIAEDDRTVSSIVAAYLTADGINVKIASEGHDALTQWRAWKPDAVVLDIMLPRLSGLDILRTVRASGDKTPIIVLSARGDTEDRIVGLETGADDYLSKPFSPRELMLRIKAMLRRDEQLRANGVVADRQVAEGDLLIDTAAHAVTRAGRTIELTRREFDLLTFLALHRDEAFSKEELLQRVWGWDFGDKSTVIVHIRRLRRKIEDDPSDPYYVVTVRGHGYRFRPPSDAEPNGPGPNSSEPNGARQ